MAVDAPLLETDCLSVAYGGLRAASDISLRVGSGQLVGLIGPNGAGKTTFLDAVLGFVGSSGSVVFDGAEISGWNPHKRARAGLLRTWQSLELFDDLTVLENLEVVEKAAVRYRSFSPLAPNRQSGGSSAAIAVLERLGLEHLADREPGELSQGEQKLISVARALVGRPQVLCMDEPAAGLDRAESVRLGELLRGLVDDGLSLLLVDHDMSLMLSVSDVIYVMEFGEVIACGTPDAVRSDELVIAAYLGSSQSQNESGGRRINGGHIDVSPA